MGNCVPVMKSVNKYCRTVYASDKEQETCFCDKYSIIDINTVVVGNLCYLFAKVWALLYLGKSIFILMIIWKF